MDFAAADGLSFDHNRNCTNHFCLIVSVFEAIYLDFFFFFPGFLPVDCLIVCLQMGEIKMNFKNRRELGRERRGSKDI